MPRMRITSAHNPRIKQAARLREKRGRQQQQRIIIDGRRELLQALAAAARVVEVFVDGGQIDQAPLAHLAEQAERAGALVLECEPQVLSKLAFGDRNEGLVAVAETPKADLASLANFDAPLILVLEGVEKPGNIGAALRTADAAGASALLLANPRCELFNPNAIRASLGAVFTVPCAAATSGDVRDWLRERKIAIFAARVDGRQDLYAADLRQPAALVLGSEADGLEEIWSGQGISSVKIPMQGHVDSLNVSVAAAVMLFEAVRQRRTAP
jgi:RNA methyltransferase, TrmH family